MRLACLLYGTAVLAAATAFAADTPAKIPAPATDGPSTNTVNTKETPQPAAPVKGANSFTEGQAKSRFEEKGFTNITDLKKDSDGVWRGRADNKGKPVSVSLDYQGNVFSN